MTRRREDPFAYLPFAIPGLFVGLGLILGCGYLVLDRMQGPSPTPPASGHATVSGTIEWAGWRRSAAAGGPAWFLQVRLADDARDFLVAASSLSPAARERLEKAGARQNRGRLPSLEGRTATITVDSSFQERPRPQHPYMQTLQVNGTAIVPRSNPGTAPREPSALFVILNGIGLLAGLGIGSVSLHHLAVCVRHSRQSGAR